MNNLSKSQKIIIIILTISILILLILISQMSSLVAETANENNLALGTGEKEQVTLSTILKKYDITFKSRNSSRIYVEFNVNLYNDDGTSNEKYFNDLITELTDFLQTTFYLVDEKNNIDIKVFYMEDGDTVIRINNQEDFYGSTNSDTYLQVENVDIIKSKNIFITEESVDVLSLYGLKYSKFVERYGEPEGQDDNGYYLFDGGDIRVAKYEGSGNIRNVIYTGKYLTQFVSRVTDKYSIDKVVQEYGEPQLGSLAEDYVGYRNDMYYMFFYSDEISLYPYGYESNKKFEKYLEQYNIDGDLNGFKRLVTNIWDGYFECEYDEENQSLLLTYPTKGVKIEISDNSTKNITFYSNYYFSDDLKDDIKNGYYTLKADEDYLDVVERERKIND